MANLRGFYGAFEHDRPQTWDFLRQWQPSFVKVMPHGSTDPQRISIDRIVRLLQLFPDVIVAIRIWDVDDNNEQAKDAMHVDPEGEAARQHAFWNTLIRRFPLNVRERLVACAINEPETQAMGLELRRYTARLLQLGTNDEVRYLAYNFSVGTPSLPGEHFFDWNYFAQIEQLFVDGGHFLGLHEYMQPEGMYCVWTDDKGNRREDYGNLISRHLKCPMKRVPIVIGEWGIDGILYNRHRDPKYGHSGWKNFAQDWSPDRYGDELVECVRVAAPNVYAYCPFIDDHADGKWKSFDLEPAYGAFLARKHLMERQSIFIPIVTGPTPPAQQPIAHGVVFASAGLSVRSSPGIDATKVDELDYGTTVNIYEIKRHLGVDWFRIGPGLWVISIWIEMGGQPETSPPQPTATGIIDPLTALAFLAVESNNIAFQGGQLTIRFEVHRFKANLKNDQLFDRHFKFTPGNYNEQYWRTMPESIWQHAHADMGARHRLLVFARTLDDTAALRSTGMGMAQVMGENHARIGYATPQAMFQTFSHPAYGVNAQLMGFVNYVLSDPDLLDALRQRDWYLAATKYNGEGQQQTYVPLLEAALVRIKDAVGA